MQDMSHTERLVFVSRDDIIPPVETYISQLDEIENSLITIRNTERLVAGRVYAHVAPLTSLIATHKEWLKELEEPLATLEKCTQMINKIHNALSFFPVSAAGLCMKRIHCILLQMDVSKNTITQLKMLLESDSYYAKAAILYQKTIVDCEKICDTYKIGQERTQELSTKWSCITKGFNQLGNGLQDLDPFLYEQVYILSRKAQEFYEHSAGIKQQVQTEPKNLNELINNQCSNLHITPDKETTTTIKQILKSIREEAETVEIRDDLNLREGSLITYLTKQGNSATSQHIEQLQTQAKELQVLQARIYDNLRLLYNGGWKFTPTDTVLEMQLRLPFEVALELQKQCILQIQDSLYACLPSGQTRTGLSYAKRLLAAVSETAHTTNYFFDKIDKENKKAILATNNTLRLLSILNKPTSSTTKKVKALFVTAYSIAQAITQYNKDNESISTFNMRVISCLATMIANISKQVLTTATDFWCTIIMAKEDELDLKQVSEYIEKEMVKWLYFSPAKSSPIHLDIARHALIQNTSYTSHLFHRLKNIPRLELLYGLYKSSYDTSTVYRAYMVANATLGDAQHNLSNSEGHMEAIKEINLLAKQPNCEEITHLLEALKLDTPYERQQHK